ncbi:aa3-type cytochrome c oxidase subunit IV [Novosphingobium cyanobacteriorum]|uniref:Aa3-type cytochrome c oxidase subunit IV n=1 Tax=Novosphingobium cyanobacteriorum TaxID=3024215 RepID=A0ABT6CEA1_9SPHN|nr:aa3-type cytochrome c oxidase subunit IV [Novosphingobium cyanobacteriorum]MDF8331793.1 aa3-type cytochrome c oxidase subunit IV [Novosphingobium cyanobacteriorum]
MASGNDMKAATATYEGFVNLIKYSTPVIALIAAFVVYIIQ